MLIKTIKFLQHIYKTDLSDEVLSHVKNVMTHDMVETKNILLFA